jgi:predicted ATPase
MRISRIKVNNFKSLVDFDLPMEKFTCLIGLNGCGKSTVLQFLDFLGQLMTGEIDQWYREREWQPIELLSAFLESNCIDFGVEIVDGDDGPFGSWSGRYHVEEGYCVEERISFGMEELFVLHDRYTVTGNGESVPVHFKYRGSILSQLRDDQVPEGVRAVRDCLKSGHSLDTLNSDSLRLPSRTANGSLGHGGKNLAAHMLEMFENEPDRFGHLVAEIRAVYPRVDRPAFEVFRNGSKRLLVAENYPHPRKGTNSALLTDAKHLNDGMLRMLAFLAELESKHDLILLDEIENGINPEIVEFLVDKLVAARQQIIVTTHSPMILNYLEDEQANKSVVYLYKTDAGHTKAIRFFDIPSVAKKLKFMGPGEAFVDTKLSSLVEEIAALSKAGVP